MYHRSVLTTEAYLYIIEIYGLNPYTICHCPPFKSSTIKGGLIKSLEEPPVAFTCGPCSCLNVTIDTIDVISSCMTTGEAQSCFIIPQQEKEEEKKHV